MSAIDLCLCTFRRPHLRETLRSLAAQTLQPARIIIADNDETPSAKVLVEACAQEFGLSLTYIHAPARNISIARNACLEAASADLIAFIDDDEIAPPGWLTALQATFMETKADAVLGPVEAVYSEAAPRWMQQLDLHATRPVWVDGAIITGYSCNVLFRRTVACFAGLRFRPELGRSGGEDTAFFTAAHAKGAQIAFAADAWLYEDVTPERATFRWLWRRRYRAGQTHALLLMEMPNASRFIQIVKTAAKAAICFALAAAFVLWPAQRNFWLLRGALHVGAVAHLLGATTVENYG